MRIRFPDCLAQLILIAVVGLGCSRQNPKSAAEGGKVVGNFYTNSYLGISISPPTGWHALDRTRLLQVMRQGITVMSDFSRTEEGVVASKAVESLQPQLVGFFQHPPGTPTTFNPCVLVLAEEISEAPGILTARDYLVHLMAGFRQMGVHFVQHGDIEGVQACGKPAFRVAYAFHIMNQAVEQKYLTVLIRGHAVSIVLAAANEDDLKEMESCLQTFRVY